MTFLTCLSYKTAKRNGSNTWPAVVCMCVDHLYKI